MKKKRKASKRTKSIKNVSRRKKKSRIGKKRSTVAKSAHKRKARVPEENLGAQPGQSSGGSTGGETRKKFSRYAIQHLVDPEAFTRIKGSKYEP